VSVYVDFLHCELVWVVVEMNAAFVDGDSRRWKARLIRECEEKLRKVENNKRKSHHPFH